MSLEQSLAAVVDDDDLERAIGDLLEHREETADQRAERLALVEHRNDDRRDRRHDAVLR
jgi:hypothetical protein